MPINDGSGVTPGEICFSCAKMQNLTCPYGNHKKASTLEFTAEMNGVCMVYAPVEDMEAFDLTTVTGGSSRMKKMAEKMTDSELNVSLYRKIKALKEGEKQKLYNYWKYLFPKDFAKDMVTDSNESAPQGVDDTKTRSKKRKDKKEKENKKVKKDTKFTD